MLPLQLLCPGDTDVPPICARQYRFAQAWRRVATMGNTNCTLASEYDSLPICCAGGSGTFISSSNIFPGYEQSSPAATSILYLALLLWLFMGVAMAADVFMAAIETITSTVTLVKNKMPGNVQHSSLPWRCRLRTSASASYHFLLLVRVHGGTFERLAVCRPWSLAHARTLAVRPARGCCCSCVQLLRAARACSSCVLLLTDRAPRHLSLSLSLPPSLSLTISRSQMATCATSACARGTPRWPT